jgi:hypothetical protein
LVKRDRDRAVASSKALSAARTVSIASTRRAAADWRLPATPRNAE